MSAAGRGKTTRISFNKNEVIPQFEGDKKDKATAFRFMHIFLQHAYHFNWKSQVWNSELRAHVDNKTWDWFSQLPKNQRRDLKLFRNAFRLRFMKTRYPRDEAYLTATQGPYEDLEDFIIRFNKLAQRAGKDTFASAKNWREHFRKLLNALTDDSLRTRLTYLNPRTWTELDQIVNDMQQDAAHAEFLQHRKRHAAKTNQPSSTRQAFAVTVDNQLEVPIAAAPVSDDLIELAYMFAIAKTPGPKEMCNLCQKMHPAGECWAKLLCAVCGISWFRL